MPGPFTLAEMRVLVLRELQDPTGKYFTETLVDSVLNHVTGVFVEKTGLRRATTVINVVAENAIVDLSSVTPMVLKVLRVALPSSEDATDELKLKKTSEEDLELADPNWRNTRGIPRAYMRWNQGHKKLMLYPKPSTNFSSWIVSDGAASFDSMTGLVNALESVNGTFDTLYGTLIGLDTSFGACRVDYIAGATLMTADADTPYTKSEVPGEHHYAIWRGAVGVCLRMETALKQLERAKDYLAEFESELLLVRGDVKADFQDKPIESVEYVEL